MKIQLVILALLMVIVSACDRQEPEPTRTCLDFQIISSFPQTFPGPTFTVTSVPGNSLVFTNPKDPGGNPIAITLEDRVEDQDGKPELNVGFSKDTDGYQPLFVEFPLTGYPNGVKDVEVELMHFASATILALDSGGNVISTATQPVQNTRTVLSLPGQNIRRLQFNMIETLVYKICWLSLPAHECQVTIDFETPLMLGKQYGNPVGNKSGDVVVTTKGVKVSVFDFNFVGGGGAFNVAYIDTASILSGAGQNIRTNNINLEFDFSSLNFTVSGVQFDFLDEGGIENISINGSPIYAGDLASVTSPMGGVTISVYTSAIQGHNKGSVILSGAVQTLIIGGQEFWLDNICVRK